MKKPDTWMPLFIADYLADTGHLSTTEHGAYLLLLMQAWMNGGTLPTQSERLRCITRMDAKDWKRSESVLREFFEEQDGFLRHSRIDAELSRAESNVKQRSEAGKASAAKRAAKREEQQKDNGTSTGVATEASTNGQQNGKPPPPPVVLINNGEHTHTSTVKGDAVARVADFSVSKTAQACLAMREQGIASVNPSHPKLIALVEAGATPQEFRDAALEGKSKGKGFAYILGIVQGRREEAAKMDKKQISTAPEKKQSGPPWWSSESGMLNKGREFGLTPNRGEDWSSFKGRINAAIEKQGGATCQP